MRKEWLLVTLLVTASFLIRVFRLDTPPSYMFDEVYHAFTAVELERGNKAAWEWWNTPPQGFAYEWTHPPLAKEMMILGLKTLGPILPKQAPGVDGRVDPNPFTWRFPVALFGAGIVYLVYLLGKQLFSARVGLIAAFLINFDGLLFVQSRIGMNDTFFLFFILLAFYFFLKYQSEAGPSLFQPAPGSSSAQRFGHSTLSSSIGGVRGALEKGDAHLLLMGISLGLALASKWTAIYGMGILGILYLGSWIVDRGSWKSTIHHLSSIILVFVFIPLLIYLLTYLPFFTSGHTWPQFDELQHQMWWYHTRLKATHPFTSPWYSWPVMYRPVWYYVKYGEDTIANIYAMGNPAIWWPGMVAIGYATVVSIKYLVLSIKQKRLLPTTFYLLLVPIGYFGFFLPWALSPRIMFLYHYLPSVPFMCLALGYGLDKIWPRQRLLVYGYLLVVLAVFIYFYPHLSGLAMPKWWVDRYFWFPSWR